MQVRRPTGATRSCGPDAQLATSPTWTARAASGTVRGPRGTSCRTAKRGRQSVREELPARSAGQGARSLRPEDGEGRRRSTSATATSTLFANDPDETLYSTAADGRHRLVQDARVGRDPRCREGAGLVSGDSRLQRRREDRSVHAPNEPPDPSSIVRCRAPTAMDRLQSRRQEPVDRRRNARRHEGRGARPAIRMAPARTRRRRAAPRSTSRRSTTRRCHVEAVPDAGR